MNPDDCRNISGGRVFVNDAPMSFRSAMHKFVMVSMTQTKIAAGIMVVQDMLYMYHLLESLDLKVELPMVLKVDNSGAVDIANSQSVNGRMRHVDVRNHFLHKLNYHVLLIIRHNPRDSNDVYIFTKNVTSTVFNHHVLLYVGINEYVQVQDQASSGEAVRE